MRSPPPVTLLLDAADDAERTGHLPAAAWLLHDAARLGAATAAAPRLAALATATDSALVAARAEHAAALAAGDGARLAAAADRFEALGALLAGRRGRCRRRRRVAAAAGAAPSRRARSSARASSRRDARGRGRRRSSDAATVVPLTDREREIAVLAADGQPSRADRRAALPLGAHGRQPPRPHLRQARRVQPRRPRRRPRTGRQQP